MTSTFKESSRMVSLKVSTSHNAFPTTIIFQIKIKNTQICSTGILKLLQIAFALHRQQRETINIFLRNETTKKCRGVRDE